MRLGSPLLTESEIESRVNELAEAIKHDLGDNFIAIGILKGSFIFLADLVRKIGPSVKIDFISASSYGFSRHTSGNVEISRDCEFDITGKDVLVVEDIIDTGFTLQAIVRHLLTKAPRALSVCTLLDKKEARLVDARADYVGFEVPNVFIVGYGIDCSEEFRSLPYISFVER